MHGGTLTTQQHVNTIAKPQIAPAVPTTHVNRINNITPKIFWIHGKKHPISVPEIYKRKKKKENIELSKGWIEVVFVCLFYMKKKRKQLKSI